MADGTPPLVFVDLYQGSSRKLLSRAQTWRWRALNGNNFRVLAVSSENYTNVGDALSAIQELFGSGTTVFLRQHEQGNVLLRRATDA